MGIFLSNQLNVKGLSCGTDTRSIYYDHDASKQLLGAPYVKPFVCINSCHLHNDTTRQSQSAAGQATAGYWANLFEIAKH